MSCGVNELCASEKKVNKHVEWNFNHFCAHLFPEAKMAPGAREYVGPMSLPALRATWCCLSLALERLMLPVSSRHTSHQSLTDLLYQLTNFTSRDGQTKRSQSEFYSNFSVDSRTLITENPFSILAAACDTLLDSFLSFKYRLELIWLLCRFFEDIFSLAIVIALESMFSKPTGNLKIKVLMQFVYVERIATQRINDGGHGIVWAWRIITLHFRIFMEILFSSWTVDFHINNCRFRLNLLI